MFLVEFNTDKKTQGMQQIKGCKLAFFPTREN